MVAEVLAAGAVLGKTVGELVEAVKDAGQKISTFQSIFRKIESTLDTITPRLDEIIDLDEKLNHSSTTINDLVDLVNGGKVHVDKCSKVDRFNILKVRKYHKLLVDFESNLLNFFSTNLQLDQSKDAREALLLLREIKKCVQAMVVETEDEAEGSTSRERKDDQVNDLEIPIKFGYETSSSSGIVPVEEICARDLAIEWIKDGQYWKWSSITETSSNLVYEVAELLKVWYLHVRGYFDTETLQHGIEYKVVLIVMLIESASGWEVPVKLKLILPDGSIQQRKERFKSKPRNQWLQITVGNFTMSPSMDGTLEFLLEEVTDTAEKNGILIKGAVITKAL